MPSKPTTALAAPGDEEPEDDGEPELKPSTNANELSGAELATVEKTLRGKHDLSRLERENPRLVGLVAWLLTIPGMDWNTIVEHARMDWRTIGAIQARRTADMAEFRHRSAQMIALVLEAAGPGLLKRAAAGKLNAFEFKQLVDAWGVLSAQAMVRSEHTINITVTQAEAELMKIVDVGSAGIHTLPCQTEWIKSVHGMGLDSQKVHALPLQAEAELVPDGVRDCEGLGQKQADSQQVQAPNERDR